VRCEGDHKKYRGLVEGEQDRKGTRKLQCNRIDKEGCERNTGKRREGNRGVNRINEIEKGGEGGRYGSKDSRRISMNLFHKNIIFHFSTVKSISKIRN
jgi:hypothetical protein